MIADNAAPGETRKDPAETAWVLDALYGDDPEWSERYDAAPDVPPVTDLAEQDDEPGERAPATGGSQRETAPAAEREPQGRKGPVIVVGVDGTAGSRAALAYALDEAGRRDARLEVVMAIAPDRVAVGGGRFAVTPTLAQVTAVVEGALRRLVDEVRGELVPPVAEVDVDVQALLGAPATVLIEQAARAEDLVVGHRGRGEMSSLLLGSVGIRCVLHAPCRVTVVRADADERVAVSVSSTPGTRS